MNVENKKYDYEGCHATGDILLKEYPENMIDLVRDCIKYSNLTIVSEHIKQFTPEASTAVWVLSESHFTLHEYPESNYITVDCYTCGEEGDPLAAINNLIENLDKSVGVKKKNVRYFKRGEFKEDKKTISMTEKAFWNTDIKEVNEMQSKMDKVTQSLTLEQIKLLEEVMNWTEQEKICDESYNNEQFH